MGRGDIRSMIEEGRTAQEIKATWADEAAAFRKKSEKYRLYPD